MPPAQPEEPEEFFMSDLITHRKVFEDWRRLVLHDRCVGSLPAQVMNDQRVFARPGALTRGGGRLFRTF